MEKIKESSKEIENKIEIEKLEQMERGERIKNIREKELKLKKSQMGKQIGVSGQFLGLVEEGKGNLSYKSIKILRQISGHSSDYILYGLDDSVIENTRSFLNKYDENEIIKAIEAIKSMAMLIKK